MIISEYLQWQRGLVKRLIGWSELLLVQKKNGRDRRGNGGE